MMINGWKFKPKRPLLIFRKQNELSLIKNETLLMIMATNHIDLIIKMRIQQLLNNCVEFQLYVPKSRRFSYLWNIITDWMSARHEYRIKWGTFSYATEFKAHKRKNKEHFLANAAQQWKVVERSTFEKWSRAHFELSDKSYF